MGWEQRKTGRFYYRSLRIGDRVRKMYYGRGEAARFAAELDAESRERRASRAAILGAEEAAIAPAESAAAAFERVLALLNEASLMSEGYHRHSHGQWTRRKS